MRDYGTMKKIFRKRKHLGFHFQTLSHKRALFVSCDFAATFFVFYTRKKRKRERERERTVGVIASEPSLVLTKI